MNKWQLLLPICYLSAVPGLVSAEETKPETKKLAAMEKIEITAQRTVENIQDAAVPIDAASGAELSRVGVTSASGLNKISPALNVVTGGGSNNVFFVRGVGNFAVNAYTDAALAFNVDGVFIGRPTATTASFLDVERIEVLKGPQGTLYGRNATAGAINIIPVKPELGEVFGKVSVGVGNYGKLETSAAINIPLGDDWATRFAVGKVENDGYNDDGTADTDDMAFRGQLYGEITPDVNVRISADYSTSQGSGNAPTFLGNYGFPLAGPTDNPNNIPGYNFIPAPENVSSAHTGAFTDEAKSYYGTLNTTPAFTPITSMLSPHIDNVYQGISAEINVNLGFGDLVVIPAYREAEIDVIFNNPGFQAAFNQENHKQASLEARLSMSTGDIDWIFGGFYFDEKVDGLASFNQFSLQSTQEIRESSTESKAFFARAKYNISEDLRLVGAVRWTDDKKRLDATANVFLNLCIRDLPAYPGGPEIPNCEGAPVIPAAATVEETLALMNPADLPLGAPVPGRGPVPYGQIPLFPGAPDFLKANILMINPTVVDRTSQNDEITYRVAVEYDLTDNNLMYVSYETGYRSGGFSPTTGHEEFDPEYIDAYTLGFKNRFLDDALQLNAEIFLWDYQDQQASHFGIDGNGNSAFFTENIGQSSIQGVELDILYVATDTIRLKANIQYLDNEIEEFSYLQKTPDEAVQVVTGCETSVIDVVEGEPYYNVDCSGQEGRNSPKLSMNFGIDKYFEFDSGMYVITSLDARYRDDRWVGFDFTPLQRAEAVTTLDASLELYSEDDTWSVTAFVRNITDEEIKAATQVFSSGSNLMSATYEPPRTYGVTFNYDF